MEATMGYIGIVDPSILFRGFGVEGLGFRV